MDEDDVIDEMLDQQRQANKDVPRGNALRVASMARKTGVSFTGSGSGLATAGSLSGGSSHSDSRPHSPTGSGKFDWAVASLGEWLLLDMSCTDWHGLTYTSQCAISLLFGHCICHMPPAGLLQPSHAHNINSIMDLLSDNSLP